MHSDDIIPDTDHGKLPDAELRTCLVDLNVTSRAELICLQEGNDASFTNCMERKRTDAKSLLCITNSVQEEFRIALSGVATYP